MALVGYWPLDETSGTNAPDESGNDNDGTLNGFPVSDTHELNEFENSSDGFTGKYLTITENADSITITPDGSDPQLIKSSMSIVGENYFIITVRIKRTAGSVWQGVLYYTTSGHSYSENYRKAVSEPSNFSEYQIIEFDMRHLTAGGSDWVDNTITAIRFDFGDSADDEFEIDYIKIGRDIWADGVVGKCLSFNGVDEYVSIPFAYNFTAYTFSFWQDACALKMALGSADDTFYKYGEASWHDPIDEWYHGVDSYMTGRYLFTVTWDGATQKIYVNGVERASRSHSGTCNFNSTLYLGKYAVAGHEYTGLIDEVRIYNTALTASEAEALFRNPSGAGPAISFGANF